MNPKEFGHRAWSHDSIADLGFDWSRIGDPGIAPKDPFKVYLPRDAEDVVAAVAETTALGQRLVIRGSGHSGNDLVLAEHGALLVTTGMNRIRAVDPEVGSVTVEAGAYLADVDRRLAACGLGLPIVGDHRHITAGGFASVGGVSPASHLYGLFVDNVRAIEYVTPTAERRRCGRDDDPAQLRRLLTGCGRYGVIVSLELDVLRIDKSQVWLTNDANTFRSIDLFVEHGVSLMTEARGARMQRGYWTDVSDRRSPRFGQWANYQVRPATAGGRLRRGVSQVTRSAYRRAAVHTPAPLQRLAQAGAGAAIVCAPRHLTLQDAEVLADTVLNYGIGHPIRWFVAWVPLSRYRSAFHRIHSLFGRYRADTGCFTSISVLTQAIRSPYLGATAADPYCQIMMICGVRPDRLTGRVLGDLVAELDDICLDESALRYLHTPTTADPAKLAALDPNKIADRAYEDSSEDYIRTREKRA
ncbi:FAD-binding oxidoreductase [Nocardia sp. NBC_01499]|uniref:FAD-binding oxidoreductase n=1 Tax=Nocardia sp. NBC_01499 TaxID=2903597 RepID=UPI003865B73D